MNMRNLFFKRIMSAKLTRRQKRILGIINEVSDNTSLYWDLFVLQTVLQDLAGTRGLDVRVARILLELHFMAMQIVHRAQQELSDAAR